MKRTIFIAVSAISMLMASCSHNDEPIPYTGGVDGAGAVSVMRTDDQWHAVSDTTIWMPGTQGEYMLEVKSEGIQPSNVVDIEVYGSEKMTVTLIDSVPEEMEPYEVIIKRTGIHTYDRRDTTYYYKQRLRVTMPVAPQMLHSVKFRIQTDMDYMGNRRYSDFTFMKS